MNSPEIKQFIRDNAALFWHLQEEKKEEVSREVLVETILNYGSLQAVKQLLVLLGIGETAKIFFNSIAKSNRRKNNYHELVINYFTLFFKHYAS